MHRAASIPPRPLAALVLGISVLLGLLSLLPYERVANTGPFNLDREIWRLGIGAAWSTLLLLGAGAAGFLAADALGSRAVGALAAFLVFMAIDESAGLHEKLEVATDVDWQLLYLPVVAVGGVAFLLVVRRVHAEGMREPLLLLCGGAAAWLFATVLETVQWDGDRKVDGYYFLSIVEEVAEMTGSLLFGLAMLALVRRSLRPA